MQVKCMQHIVFDITPTMSRSTSSSQEARLHRSVIQKEQAYLSGNPVDTLHTVRESHQLHLAGSYCANQLLPQHQPGLCSAMAQKVGSMQPGRRAEGFQAWKPQDFSTQDGHSK